MSKCIIIGSIYHGEEMEFLKKEPGDLLLCADAGLEKALQYGFRPDLVIGDFDSMPEPHETDTIHWRICSVLQTAQEGESRDGLWIRPTV